jgi:hypothetical protein
MWCSLIGPFLAHVGISVFLAFSCLGWFLHSSQAVETSTFLRCHWSDLYYGTFTKIREITERFIEKSNVYVKSTCFTLVLLAFKFDMHVNIQ